MKQPTRALTALVAALALLVAPLAIAPAHAGDLEAARAHYQRGKELYRAGDYRAAIGEFAAADREVPSPVNEYNIALCYDRLGDGEEALRRYRSYLEKVPSAANRGEVETAIARLETAARAEKPEPEPVKEPPAVEAPQPGAEGPPPAVETAPPPAEAEEPPAVTEPPESEMGARTQAAPATGDPELDRVAAIDVAAIRDARLGVAEPAEAAAPPPDPAVAAAEPPVGAEPPAALPATDTGDDDENDPVYKQWWFWVVIGVSAIILIDIAASDSEDPAARALDFGAAGMNPGAPSSAPVLLRF